MRRQRQRVGLTHKVSDAGSSVAVDTPVSFTPTEGEIDPAEFVVCRDARGEEVCIGEGNFGKACTCAGLREWVFSSVDNRIRMPLIQQSTCGNVRM